MDGRADARIGAAATDVAAHRVVDVLIGGLGRVLQERGGLHDLAALAEAALGDVLVAPRHLHRMVAVGRQPLDGDDLLALGRRDRRDAGAGRRAAEMDGAGAAERDAAAELGAGEPEFVAEVPQQRHVGIAVEAARSPVHGQFDHRFVLSGGAGAAFSRV